MNIATDTVRFTDTDGATVDITADEWVESTGYHSFDNLVATEIGNAVVDGMHYSFRGDRDKGELIVWNGDHKMVGIEWAVI